MIVKPLLMLQAERFIDKMLDAKVAGATAVEVYAKARFKLSDATARKYARQVLQLLR